MPRLPSGHGFLSTHPHEGVVHPMRVPIGVGLLTMCSPYANRNQVVERGGENRGPRDPIGQPLYERGQFEWRPLVVELHSGECDGPHIKGG